VAPTSTPDRRVELYDSGATRHISPYHTDFTLYRLLTSPVYLNTANQQHFPTIGVGRLAIWAPNGDSQSSILLKNVLHAPAVSFTLISVGTLDRTGYHRSFGGGPLDLHDTAGACLAHIPLSDCDLYCVEHMGESVHAVETISVMELHCHMGHITPASAHTLITRGLVMGM